jgi:hypothetical protein
MAASPFGLEEADHGRSCGRSRPDGIVPRQYQWGIKDERDGLLAEHLRGRTQSLYKCKCERRELLDINSGAFSVRRPKALRDQVMRPGKKIEQAPHFL